MYPANIGSLSIEQHIEILLTNYEYYFGENLLPADLSIVDAVEYSWNASFVIVSHGVQADPVFNFANKQALELFEMHFNGFTKLPSRKSAEQPSRLDRKRLLDEVLEYGCISDYTGVRISSTGRRFFIKNARVWNLYDEDQAFYGQAASFKSWAYLN